MAAQVSAIEARDEAIYLNNLQNITIVSTPVRERADKYAAVHCIDIPCTSYAGYMTYMDPTERDMVILVRKKVADITHVTWSGVQRSFRTPAANKEAQLPHH
ncbi:hypothetical protein HPB48_008017 [Haemaphysalis longicornis]|uniref:Uncharacterized protein n=1 Tax=Haemaphysalis longicornis TaxID=44386 RepID=A0A9J6G8Z6_HAELO|nr:hypothetical protein HPB48_008017 [Haemaphysalis longicornis]